MSDTVFLVYYSAIQVFRSWLLARRVQRGFWR